MFGHERNSGFELLRKPAKLLEEYVGSEHARRNAELLAQIRSSAWFVEPANYRGIAREPLEVCSSGDRIEKEVGKEASARGKLFEAIAAQRTKCAQFRCGWDYGEDEGLLPGLDQAVMVFKSLETPEDYEIVEVSLEPFSREFELLGYDIGYWGGDHFSVICDSVVMPRWHPHSPDGIAELVSRLSKINQHILLDTVEDAKEFLEFYMFTNWGEKEVYAGQFCIICVGHQDPIGSHWDYTDDMGKKWRVNPDGTKEPKP